MIATPRGAPATYTRRPPGRGRASACPLALALPHAGGDPRSSDPVGAPGRVGSRAFLHQMRAGQGPQLSPNPPEVWSPMTVPDSTPHSTFRQFQERQPPSTTFFCRQPRAGPPSTMPNKPGAGPGGPEAHSPSIGDGKPTVCLRVRRRPSTHSPRAYELGMDHEKENNKKKLNVQTSFQSTSFLSLSQLYIQPTWLSLPFIYPPAQSAGG
jgi:hypothetical protein